jgi:iron complex transport system substrate-binding protein
VAVLFSSLAEMWQDAGGEVAITVGESVSRGIVAEGTPLVDGGAGKTVDAEALIAASPDLVIGSADIAAHKALAPILEKASIPFALFRVDTLSDYERVMGVMCAITCRADLYESKAVAVRNTANEVLASVPDALARPRILFVRVGSGYSATKAKRTNEHFVCAML